MAAHHTLAARKGIANRRLRAHANSGRSGGRVARQRGTRLLCCFLDGYELVAGGYPAEEQSRAGTGFAAAPPLFACGSRHAVGPDVVVTVGPNALLFFRRGHGDAAPRAGPGPRFDAMRGLVRGIARDAQFANPGPSGPAPGCSVSVGKCDGPSLSGWPSSPCGRS